MSAQPIVDLSGLDPEPESITEVPDGSGAPDLDEVQIDRILGRVRELRRQAYEIDRIADERIDDVQRWRADRQAVLAGSIDHRLALLQAWHEHLLAKDPDRKSVPLPSGTLKSRASAERIEVTDTRAFVEWAKVNAPDLVREKVTHEPAKKALPGPLRLADSQVGPQVIDSTTGEPVPGVAWKPASRTFSVDTPMLEDGAA